MAKSKQIIVAIDPGREKCGLAIISQGEVLMQEVVAREKLTAFVKAMLPSSGPIVIGDRTGCKEFIAELEQELPLVKERIVTVNEHLSSVEAKKLYWKTNPPKGLRRLIPSSLQVPPVPIDDFVAVILANRYLHDSHHDQ